MDQSSYTLLVPPVLYFFPYLRLNQKRWYQNMCWSSIRSFLLHVMILWGETQDSAKTTRQREDIEISPEIKWYGTTHTKLPYLQWLTNSFNLVEQYTIRNFDLRMKSTRRGQIGRSFPRVQSTLPTLDFLGSPGSFSDNNLHKVMKQTAVNNQLRTCIHVLILWLQKIQTELLFSIIK